MDYRLKLIQELETWSKIYACRAFVWALFAVLTAWWELWVAIVPVLAALAFIIKSQMQQRDADWFKARLKTKEDE